RPGRRGGCRTARARAPARPPPLPLPLTPLRSSNATGTRHRSRFPSGSRGAPSLRECAAGIEPPAGRGTGPPCGRRPNRRRPRSRARAAAKPPALVQVRGEDRESRVVLERRRGGPVAPALIAVTLAAPDGVVKLSPHFERLGTGPASRLAPELERHDVLARVGEERR